MDKNCHLIVSFTLSHTFFLGCKFIKSNEIEEFANMYYRWKWRKHTQCSQLFGRVPPHDVSRYSLQNKVYFLHL